MRKSIGTPAAVFTAAAALTLGAPTASQAFTQKELSICWDNRTPSPAPDLEMVADGPSYRTATLDAGDCVAWDVRPGQYKITLEDIEEQSEKGQQLSVDCGDESYDSGFTVKRGRESYNVPEFAILDNGGFTTDVKKNRRTSITIWQDCVPDTD
jgi:hypothetical protein